MLKNLDEFQVVVRAENEADPYSMDEMVVRIACKPEHRDLLTGEVAARAAEVTRVRALVEVVDAADIYDPGRQTKAARFVDRRKERQ